MWRNPLFIATTTFIQKSHTQYTNTTEHCPSHDITIQQFRIEWLKTTYTPFDELDYNNGLTGSDKGTCLPPLRLIRPY